MNRGQGELQEMYPLEGESYQYRWEEEDGSFILALEGDVAEGQEPSVTISIDLRDTAEGICRTGSGRTFPFAWAWIGAQLHLWLDGDLHIFRGFHPSTRSGRRRGRASDPKTSGDVLAPMPGAVLEVLVSEGDQVEQNQTVVVMESMKMELLISAPRDGVVSRVSVQVGQLVERGMRLLELAPQSSLPADELPDSQHQDSP